MEVIQEANAIKSLKIIMDKEFAELNIKTKSSNKKIVKKDETAKKKLKRKKMLIPLLLEHLSIEIMQKNKSN